MRRRRPHAATPTVRREARHDTSAAAARNNMRLGMVASRKRRPFPLAEFPRSRCGHLLAFEATPDWVWRTHVGRLPTISASGVVGLACPVPDPGGRVLEHPKRAGWVRHIPATGRRGCVRIPRHHFSPFGCRADKSETGEIARRGFRGIGSGTFDARGLVCVVAGRSAGRGVDAGGVGPAGGDVA